MTLGRLPRLLALLCCLVQPVAAQEAAVDLGREAQAAFSSGHVELARLLALAALNADPRDPTALVVLGAVGLATGEPAAAREVALRSFRLAPDARGKFTAARVAARASVDLGQNGAAKYWLRRAVQVAPTEEARAATVRDFLAVRSISRLRFDLVLSVKPSDNVNQGADDALLTIDGRPTWFYFDASTMALSGVETTSNLALRYRIAGTAALPTEIGFRAYGRFVTLSEEAQRQVPDLDGSDFFDTAFDLFLQHRMALGTDRVLNMGLTLGSTWLAEDPYADRARVDLSLTSAHGPAMQSRLGFSVERQWLATGSAHATAVTLDAGLQRLLPGGDVIGVKFALGQTLSDDANKENRQLGASLRYVLGKPVAGFQISAGLDVTSRDYPVFFNGIFNDTGRQDVSVSANIDIGVPKMGVFGFEPILSLEAGRTTSNVSRYSSEAMGIGLRIESSF